MTSLCSKGSLFRLTLLVLAAHACGGDPASNGTPDDGDKAGAAGSSSRAGGGGRATGGTGGSGGGSAGAAGTSSGGATAGSAGSPSAGAAGGEAGASAGAAGGAAGAAGAGGAVAPGKPEWCNDPKFRIGATDGVHTSEEIITSTQTGDPANGATDPSAVGKADGGGANYTAAYVPGSYGSAANGTVAVFMEFGVYGDEDTRINRMLDNLAFRKETPVIIAVKPSFALTDYGKYKSLLAELKTKYPKISDKPEYHIVSGQSTAGAQAFDAAWDNSDTIGGAIVGSGSYVCFMGKSGGSNDGYANMIKSSPLKPIRIAGNVGTCDIYGNLESRLAAGCSSCTDASCVDASNCAATWLTVNKNVAAAMMSKGMKHQLIVVKGGVHKPGSTWTAQIGDHFRWVFRGITCGN